MSERGPFEDAEIPMCLFVRPDCRERMDRLRDSILEIQSEIARLEEHEDIAMVDEYRSVGGTE